MFNIIYNLNKETSNLCELYKKKKTLLGLEPATFGAVSMNYAEQERI